MNMKVIIDCFRLSRVKVFTIGNRKKYHQLNDNSFKDYPVINICLRHALIEMKILPKYVVFFYGKYF